MGLGSKLKKLGGGKIAKLVKHTTNPLHVVKPSHNLDPVGSIAKAMGINTPLNKPIDKIYNKIDKVWEKTDPLSVQLSKTLDTIFDKVDIHAKLLDKTKENGLEDEDAIQNFEPSNEKDSDSKKLKITYKGKDYVLTKKQIKDMINDTSLPEDLRKSLKEILETGVIKSDVTELIKLDLPSFTSYKGLDTSSINLPQFIALDVMGIKNAYDVSTWNTEEPDLPAIIGAVKVKAHDENGVFIGSLPTTYPYVRHEVLDPNFNSCEDWNICLPNMNMPNGLKDFIDGIVDKNSLTYKTIEDINKLAEEVDRVPEARQLISILSKEYKELPQTITDKLHPNVQRLIKEYNLTPIADKEAEYDDLSAYLNAPFPELKLKEQEDNKELNKLLDQLKDLNLEDLNIPIIEPCVTDITERQVNGNGVFDHIASSIFNQLAFVRDQGLITKDEIASIYSESLVQSVQTAIQYSLEKHNITLASYQSKVAAAQASIAVLEAKTRLLMLPSQLRLAYAQIEAQMEQINLLKVQIELEKEKFPQVVAQTDLILAQTDGQRLNNEHIQVALQQSKLGLSQTQEQIALMKEQNKQAQIQTELAGLQIEQTKEQIQTIVLQNNKLIEDTKMVDAQTQLQFKQVELADIQKIESKARIKMLAQQLDKEKEGLGLIKAQVATAYAQLGLIKDQMKASRAQYSDTIEGKPIGGLLGAQIMVNKVQASSFERKAFNDFVNNLQTGWAANKTADIAISSPVSFTPLVVDRAINWGLTKYFNMPVDTVKVPKDYTPYMTDAQMDAEEPVNYKTTKKNAKK